MEHYLGVAKESGLSSSEIGAVQACVMAVAAGKVNSQVREASARSEPCTGEDTGGGCQSR